jgi:predicted nucleotidyltransferase
VDRRFLLDAAARRHNLLAVYLFGSRADEGLSALEGGTVARDGSDLDVGVFAAGHLVSLPGLAELQVALEDVFAPLRVDLVPLDRVDGLFQFRAISGHRVYVSDSTRADLLELLVMRRGADLLPIQRRLELDLFGVSSS